MTVFALHGQCVPLESAGRDGGLSRGAAHRVHQGRGCARERRGSVNKDVHVEQSHAHCFSLLLCPQVILFAHELSGR